MLLFSALSHHCGFLSSSQHHCPFFFLSPFFFLLLIYCFFYIYFPLGQCQYWRTPLTKARCCRQGELSVGCPEAGRRDVPGVSDVKERREEPRREKKPLQEGESESIRSTKTTSPVPQKCVSLSVMLSTSRTGGACSLRSGSDRPAMCFFTCGRSSAGEISCTSRCGGEFSVNWADKKTDTKQWSTTTAGGKGIWRADAPAPLLLHGRGRERKEGKLSLAACSKKYSTPGLKPLLWTDNLTYRTPHRCTCWQKDAGYYPTDIFYGHMKKRKRN